MAMDDEEYVTLNLKDGSTYFGPVDSRGLPHGFGERDYHNNEKHFCEWIHGLAHGEGKIEREDPTRTVEIYCNWVNGYIQGKAEAYFYDKITKKVVDHYELTYSNSEIVSRRRLPV